MQLSKSEYMMFLKHPAWLWLKKHDKSKLPETDDNQQAIFDSGHLFESYAEQLFPGGTKLGFDNYNEYLSLPARTKEAIDNGAKTIFQGRFESGDLTCICDVVIFVDSETIDLIEIKSSSRAKQEHEYDLAFQVAVLEGCGYQVREVSVLHVNNFYVRKGDIDPKKLTKITDITEKVVARRDEAAANITEALRVMASPTIPNIAPSLCKMGSYGEWLQIYKTLVPVEPGSIYDLSYPTVDCIARLEAADIKRLIDIPDDFELTSRQRLQIKAAKENRELIETDKIVKFLKGLRYPLYFLDYETMSSVVPPFDGLSPNCQLPFQLSLHVLESEDSEVKHYEYLHRENTNPAQDLTTALQKCIGDDGTILVWYEAFEKGCHKLLGRLLPEYEKFYEGLNKRVADLMTPFSKGWYVNKDFQGSASIKKVLPVLVPELTYKDLGIQEGMSAQRLWMEAIIDAKRDKEKEQILSDLTEYCKLDTLAMVKIYEKLLALNKELTLF